MSDFSPAWPHGPIKEVLPDVFLVTGTNKTVFEGNDLQHSRNMIILRESGKLALINTVRLTPEGLAALEALGQVTHIVRIGAFHGRDDAFYKDRYSQAELWALEGMKDDHGASIDHVMTDNERLPFMEAKVLYFKTASFPEAALYIGKGPQLLITCDSVKNWLSADDYFNETSAKAYAEQGFFGEASISSVWLNATSTQKCDFDRIMALSFDSLLSAHGEALLTHAKQKLSESLFSAFKK